MQFYSLCDKQGHGFADTISLGEININVTQYFNYGLAFCKFGNSFFP